MIEDKEIEAIEEIHEIAKDKGFWDSMDDVLAKMDVLKKGKINGVSFTDDDIMQVKKAFIAQKIMLIVTELAESIEADRESVYSDWEEFEYIYKELSEEGFNEKVSFKGAYEGAISDTFEVEIADTLIRIIDLCKKMDINIFKHIKYKIKYNKTRDRLHGKEY